MRVRKTVAETGKPSPKKSPKCQLIGEQIGPTRMVQMRLFKTAEEAETWVKAAPGRRSRLVVIGSVAWTRALDAELKIAATEDRKCFPQQKPTTSS